MGRVLVGRWFIVILCVASAAQFFDLSHARASHGNTVAAWFWGICAFCAACNAVGYLFQSRDA